MLQQNNTDKIVVDKFICLINNSVNNKQKPHIDVAQAAKSDVL